MAPGPQIENGYTRIADEFLEALARFRIPGEQMQVLIFIIRKTWGFQKKQDSIALSQFARGTGLKKPTVCRALSGLEEKNIIIKKDNGIAKTYRINKYYENWKPLPKKITLSKKIMSVSKKDNDPLSLLSTTIKTSTKKTITKKTFSSDSDEIRLSKLLFSHILNNHPKAKQPNFQSWAKYIDLAIRIDKRSIEDLESVITWCQQDSFWSFNILSTEKLREQFDRLYMQKGSENAQNDTKNQRFSRISCDDGSKYERVDQTNVEVG